MLFVVERVAMAVVVTDVVLVVVAAGAAGAGAVTERRHAAIDSDVARRKFFLFLSLNICLCDYSN